MPKQRPPREVWNKLRSQVWTRDGGRCQYPHGKHSVPLDEAHIDRIISGKRGTNRLSELRTLCRRHHVLRADGRHRGMVVGGDTDELARDGVGGVTRVVLEVMVRRRHHHILVRRYDGVLFTRCQTSTFQVLR